jgi:Flp pilus assembly protein TadD
LRKASATLAAAGLAALVLASLWPVLHNGFTAYDDPSYVTANPHVSSGLAWANAAWAFTSAYASNWHPLTWISHQADVSLFGLSPGGHHLVNLLLHTASTVLLFLWLANLSGKAGRSAFVAALFGVHPLHVESVAWVAERKDVLSGFFLLLALISYTAYARRGGLARYVAAAVCLTAGLLSKPILVVAPLLFLLLDYWPLARLESIGLRRAIVEKLPLTALSALTSVAAFWSQGEGGSLVALDRLPLDLRVANAAIACIRYLGKAFWPVKLAAFYPYPISGIPLAAAIACALAIGALSLAAWHLRGAHPWFAVGWAWYLIALLPVIGIVQVGMQAMADRYMYLPLIGLAIAAAWECAERAPRVSGIVAPLAIAACAVISWRQAYVWKDGLTLFTHAIDVTENNFVAHDNLGVELDRLGRYDAAISEYRETLRIKPGDPHGERNLSQALLARGERQFESQSFDAALASLREGLAYQPANSAALAYAGLILAQKNQLAEALRDLRAAIAADPSNARAYMGLGVALARSGALAAAVDALEKSVSLDPRSVEAQFDLGVMYAASGDPVRADAAFDAALRLQPGYEPALDAKAQLRRSRALRR